MPPQSAVAGLLTARAVRERAHEMLELGLAGQLAHFAVDLAALDRTADYMLEVTREAYPDLEIPFHARWRHIEAGGIDRFGAILDFAGYEDGAVMGRAACDLAIVSVLLDAGAGPKWRYTEGATGDVYSRSEGLAVASVELFASGLFSSDPDDPFRVDAAALQALEPRHLAAALQVTADNPMDGFEGRVALLQRLGKHVAATPDIFAYEDSPRPGGLFDELVSESDDLVLPAEKILETVLAALGPIWPGRLEVDGIALGDCWRHAAIRRDDDTNALMPLHKLSQWLSYSLIEPLQWAGVTVTDIDGLTGLAEYRNGGLFLDSGVLQLREPGQAQKLWQPQDELIVEWRALTVALLDQLAERIRTKLGRTADELPLACVLEGGSWAAGRKLAASLRPGGAPPLTMPATEQFFESV